MSPVEQIKSKLSIVDVVGSYIKLQKAGGSYKALCPFHNEKTPSFNVSPSRDAFYCFGCNKGGDIFTFVEELEGVQFIDALKILAERAGVELKSEHRESRSERDRLLELMEEATVFYEKGSARAKVVTDYLKERGFTDQTIAKFRVGYVPNDWRLLYDHLKGKKYTDAEIERAGLIKQPGEEGGGKRPYDRFRGRIMFPLFDANGKVIAFSGRAFNLPDDSAKYINSPETPLYDKSSYLYGYNFAKQAIRKQNFVIFVEGQVDLIMAHQAGTENTVAVSGTALTANHLALIKRLSDNIVFAFDADPAGLSATTRAFALALQAGMGVRVASIPALPAVAEAKEGSKMDPADFIKSKGGEAWAEVITSAKHIIDFYLATLAERGHDARKFREEVEANVLPLVLAMRSKIEQAHFIVEIARRLGVPEKAVWDEIQRLQAVQRTLHGGRDHTGTLPNHISPDQTPEGSFVGGHAKIDPAQISKGNLGGHAKSRRQLAEEEIVGILLWQEGEKAPAVNAPELRRLYEERLKVHEILPYAPNEEEAKLLVLKAEYTYQPSQELERTVEEMLDSLEMEVLREKQADLWKRLSESEIKGAKDEAKEYLAAYQLITPRLIALEDRKTKRALN